MTSAPQVAGSISQQTQHLPEDLELYHSWLMVDPYDNSSHTALAEISVATWGAARAIADMNEQEWPTEQQLIACAELAISNHQHSDRLSLVGLILSYEHDTVAVQYDLMEYEEEVDDTEGWD